ncbi:hypothetical protein AMECASPLE_010228 [Ameca splendens]|uniref:Uncharacterized protein n=1 Tax=Ameca splendens TaxID=208324 RepID=A0ABV0YMI5_9TELE
MLPVTAVITSHYTVNGSIHLNHTWVLLLLLLLCCFTALEIQQKEDVTRKGKQSSIAKTSSLLLGKQIPVIYSTELNLNVNVFFLMFVLGCFYFKMKLEKLGC